MNTSSDAAQCDLPELVQNLVTVSMSFYSMEIPRDLMEEYFSCEGFARLLISGNWYNQLQKFPFLIALFWITVLMALLGLFWFVYEFLHQKTYRAENASERQLRLGLSIALLILLLPFSFCLWLALASYFSVDSVHTRAKKDSNEFESVVGLLEKSLKSVEIQSSTESTEIRMIVDNLRQNLASQLEATTPKVIQKGDRSFVAKLNLKGADILTVTQKMREELRSLMTDVMQLSDYTRFFLRNTSNLLNLQHINYGVYSELIFKEFKANEHKILMLLNIDYVLEQIQEVVKFGETINTLRQNLTLQMSNEFDVLQRHLNETVARESLEYTTLYANFSTLIDRMQNQEPAKVDFYLRPYIRRLEVAYCALALLILALVCVFLARFLIRAINRTITRYVLMSIISIISILIIFLCIFAIAHFLHVVVYYNYRREIDENSTFCAATTLPYCNFLSHAHLVLDKDIHNNVAAAVATHREVVLQRLCDKKLKDSSTPERLSWAKNLSNRTVFFEEIFRSGDMFDVVKQEFNFENWYELHNMLSTYASIGSIKNGDAYNYSKNQKLVACNLNIIENYIFDHLYEHDIVVSLMKLTQQAANLKSYLPGSNLTRLIKRVLRESEDLQDFCKVMENSLQKEIQEVMEVFHRHFLDVESKLKQLPLCGQFGFIRLGITREIYECIEYSVHGFHIGAFGLLILLFVILVICICLAIVYEKKGTIGLIRSTSLNRINFRDDSTVAGEQGLTSAASSLKGPHKFFVKRPTRVRFKETPTISGGKRRSKRRYFAPEQLENVTTVPRREHVQVQKKHAEPSMNRIKEKRRRRRSGPFKYSPAKSKGVIFKWTPANNEVSIYGYVK